MEAWLAVVVVAGVIALAAVLGAVWKATTGRAKAARGEQRIAPGELPGLDALAPGATLVQFSSEYCAQCPGTRRFLARVAGERGGVAHLDVDLTHRPDLAKRYDVLQTPTVLVLDGGGRLVSRIGGAPRREELLAVLDRLVPVPEWNL